MSKFLDIALTPLWVAQLVTKAKSFRGNPVLGSPALNRLGLHVARRRRAGDLARFRRQRLASAISAVERGHFDTHGYFIRHQALSPCLFEALKREVEDQRLAAREMRQGQTVTRRIGLDDDVLATLPALRSVVKDEAIRGLIRYAASYGGEPTFQIQSVLADPNRAEQDPQTLFHSDTFHPTAKAWLFLTDVGEDDGPFAYVPGSHRLTPARLDWERQQSLEARFSTDQMHGEGSFRARAVDLESLGLPAPLRMAVPANTLIVADTSGFHARSPSPKPTCRVEIYATLRRTPFLPWTGGHLLSLTGIAGHHSRLETGLQRTLEWLHLGRSVWRPVGTVNAFDPPSI